MSFFKKLFGSPEEENVEQQSSLEEETSEEEHEKKYEFETLRDDGLRAMNIHQEPYAIKCFEAAREYFPDNEEIQGYLAEAHIHVGQGKEAMKLLVPLVEKHPESFKLLYACVS